MKKRFVLYLAVVMMLFSVIICDELQVEAFSVSDANETENNVEEDVSIDSTDNQLPTDDSLTINGTEDSAVAATSTVPSDSVVASFVVDNITYQELSNNTVEIEDASASSGAVTIPSTVSYNETTYTVTTIGYKAFYNCTGITSVIIPDTITEIETGIYDTTVWKCYGAFSDCKNLTEVKFSSNLTKIGKFAFLNCSSLQNVSLPGKIESIEEEAFNGCSSFTSISLPSSVNTVGQGALSGTSLTTFTIPKTCTNFSDSALGMITTLQEVNVEAGNPNYISDQGAWYTADYSWLILYPIDKKESNYTMVDSTSIIRSAAFSNVKNLYSLTISKDLTSIGTAAFQSSSVQEFLTPSTCNNYIAKDGVLYSKDGTTLLAYPTSKPDTIFFIPSGVTTVGHDGDYIWDGSVYLQELYVPASVTNFNTIMWNSKNLKKVVFAKNINISEIPGWCFQNCTSLESICIPDSVTSLAQDFYGNTFLWCNNLKSIYIGDNSKLYSWNNYGTQTLIGCPNLTVYAYGNDNNISNFASTFNVKYMDITSYTGKILGMTFDDTYLNLKIGGEYQLNLTVFPTTEKKPVVSYTSSDPSVATVSETGLVHTMGTGTCYITCEAGDGSGEYTRCLIDVSANFTVTFDSEGGSSIASQTIEKGKKISIPATPVRTGYTFVGWYKEASCSNAWNFTTDLVTSDLTLYAKWNPINVTSLTLDESNLSLAKGNTHKLNAAVAPSDALNKVVTWISSNPIVATVDSNGTVTAVEPGTSVISAIASDRGIIAKTCTVNVENQKSVEWKKGNDGDLRYYRNGAMVINEFAFDGSYTYYMQANGSPMKDRLTYHPDGKHLIYLDENGHELFNTFKYCKSVGYTCYFDSNGYLYKDKLTFLNNKPYYLDGNGRLQQTGWFRFANGVDYGCANADGTLMSSGFSYDPWGRVVFYHWNGMVARGLISDGAWYYSMDTTDGHYLGQFPVH